MIVKNIEIKRRAKTVLGSMPDIDTDFPGRRRDEIKAYMEERFGKEQVCSLGTYTTFQLKEAISDMARADGIPVQLYRWFTACIGDDKEKTIEEFFKTVCGKEDLKKFVKEHTETFNDMMVILGSPKSQSVHACGTVVLPDGKTSYEWMPVHTQKGLVVTDWEGSEVEEAGFLKEDVLGIIQLDKFEEMLRLIKENHGIDVDIYSLPLDDKQVFEYAGKGWLGDVFQLGSAGLSGYCVKMKPENINELSACVALYRPGPMENNFHNEYILRKNGEKDWTEEMPIGGEEVVENTYGLMCVSEDSEVILEDGVKKIKDIVCGEKVLTEDGSYQKVLRVIDKGEKEVLSIHTSFGGEIKVTPDHKVLTQNGWKEAKDLINKKDFIKGFWRGKERKIEEKESLEDWLIGFFIAEGRCASSPYFTVGNMEVAEIVKNILLQVYPDCICSIKRYERVISKEKMAVSYRVMLVAKNGKNGFFSKNYKPNPLISLLKKKGLWKKNFDTKFLPEDCSIDMIAGILEGDGCMSNRTLHLSNNNLSWQIYCKLQEYRIYSSIRKGNDGLYLLTWYDVDNKLRFRIYKNTPISEKAGFKLPKNQMPYYIDRGITEGCTFYGRLKKYNLEVNHLVWGQVFSIHEDGVKHVYDLEVENVHSFTCEGLVVHNCFQEQIMLFCQKLADFNLETADSIRKCMGKKKLDKLKLYGEEFIKGYVSKYKDKGVTKEYAENLWKQMEEFGKYGFNKSHAVCYAMTAYICLWLKVHYPIEYWSATFSFAKDEKIPYYVNEIQQSGEIKIHPVDINKSDINIVSDYRTNSMYWAFNAVKQCGERAQEYISEEKKKNGPFFSLEEFIDRCVIKGSPVNKSVIENLIFAGAFDELENIQEPKDRLALIEMYRENKRVKVLEDKDLLTNIMKVRKERNNWWWLLQQKRTSGFAFFDYYDLVNEYHMPKLDDETEFQDVSQIKFWDINSKKTRRAVIGGYVIEIIERKSKKGIFATIVLESNYEFINVTIFPELFEEYGEFLRGSKKNILLVNGVIVWDKFRGEYILQANVNSLFTVLT